MHHDDPSQGADRLRAFRRVTIGAVASTLLLIAMGGAVRATDSGLACPDWPACYGQWIPPADLHMWLEHSHRLWAGVVALLILWLAVWAAVRHRDLPLLWRWGAAASVLVLLQAGLGAAVVLLQLRAGLVSSHLGMSWVVVGCLLVMAVASRPAVALPSSEAATVVERRVGRLGAVMASAVLMQGVLGSQATGRGAAYVFNAVPIWLAGDPWIGNARQVLHVTHRFAGYATAMLVICVALVARRLRRSTPGTPGWVVVVPRIAVALVSVQVVLGLTNVLTRASVWSAIGHLTVASWLWTVAVLQAALGSLRPAEIRAPVGMPEPGWDSDQQPVDEEILT